MNKPFSYNALIQLIDDVKMASSQGIETFINTPTVWKYELSQHPERFRMDDGNLLWYGIKVGTIGSEQKQEEFWNMVDKYVTEGWIKRYK